MNENMIIDLTDAYIASYSRALNNTHNPSLASQIATSVLFVYAQNQPKGEQVNPWAMLLKAMNDAVQQADEDEEDKEGADEDE